MNTALIGRPLLAAATAVLLLACSTPTEPPPAATQQTTAATHDAAPMGRGRGGVRAERAPASLPSSAQPAPAAGFARERRAADWIAPLTAPDRERYAHFDDHPVKRAAEQPVSTFGIDVDTASYANIRRMLQAGQLPPRDAVRVEEMINYFDYAYATPPRGSAPFRITTEIGPTPWNRERLLLHIGIKGEIANAAQLPPANLVFLIDVSGSMQSADKLPLLKSALKLLVARLRPQDRLSLVVYAGASGVVLEPTPGDHKATIDAALDGLAAGGSTNGASGIELAYAMAQQAYRANGINRVILATDGDFNVGTVDFNALMDLIARKRQSGVGLTTLGFGTGNYNDHLMEQLADKGNGNYAYIDTLNEAQKVLVEELSATLHTIAKDVKIQIEFNPAVIAEYRLIGYENRTLRREDFNNDKVDAGDIGAGHSVTALYELTLAGSAATRIDALRYGKTFSPAPERGAEAAFLRLRYKSPDATDSRLIEQALRLPDNVNDLTHLSDDFRFAAAVAGFGQLLRGGRYVDTLSYDDVLALARNARGRDPFGYRGEFLRLVALAASLDVHRRATN